MDVLVCQKCRATFSLDEPRWRCECGGLLDIRRRPEFDRDHIAQGPASLWRYRGALPLRDDKNIVSLGEGFTPLVAVDFDGVPVLVKQDQLAPTGSYKDRGASLLVSKIRELGIRRVVEDSSGNAGCAVAAYCAAAGIACEIFVPADTSAAKLAQIEAYGAALRRIPGSREDTAQAALAAAEHAYYASHVWNPFFLHGTKTFAFEVYEQLGWRSPGVVVLPVGNGTLVLGAYIGFRELRDAGAIAQIPRIVAVQAAACAPIYQAFRDDLEGMPAVEKRDTVAEGIAIAEPLRGNQVLAAVRASGGAVLAVEEAEIAAELAALCRQGYYVEPTSAATFAGLRRYLQQEEPAGLIVSVFTGHGLKAGEKVLKILPH